MSTQTKLQIPRRGASATNPNAGPIVGILQEVEAQRGRDRRIALIIHGVLAHKDQIYHKRLANELAEKRGLASFRYDLQGQGGESEGEWEMGGHELDVLDLELVISHLEGLGYDIHLICAHSRGSIFSSYFLSRRDHKNIPYFASVSGRYKMDNLSLERVEVYKKDFAKQGHSDWKVKVAGKEISRRVTAQGVRDFTEWDNSYLQTSFPLNTDVLIIHGDADMLVPVEDARTYHKIFSKRTTATSELIIIPGMGHNWGSKPFDEPVNSIVNWLGERERKHLNLKL